MPDDEIARLIQSRRDGDAAEGMRRLVETYGGRIEAAVYVFSPGVDVHGREDIRQDALLRIQRSIGERYVHRGQLWAYIKRIIRGVATDHYRRKARIDKRTLIIQSPGSEEPGVPEPAGPPGDQPDEQVARRERVRVVRDAVGQLQARCREIIDLHYTEGLRYQEIAGRLGIAMGTVSSRLARCLGQLKGHLRNM